VETPAFWVVGQAGRDESLEQVDQALQGRTRVGRVRLVQTPSGAGILQHLLDGMPAIGSSPIRSSSGPRGGLVLRRRGQLVVNCPVNRRPVTCRGPSLQPKFRAILDTEPPI